MGDEEGLYFERFRSEPVETETDSEYDPLGLGDSLDDPSEPILAQPADSAEDGDFPGGSSGGSGRHLNPRDDADERELRPNRSDTQIIQDDKRSRLKGWKLSELGARPEPVWILLGTVPAGLTVVYGPPKAGKSFWCIELATCFAAAAPFHGAVLGKSGRVLYVAAEGGGKAFYNRIMAVAGRRGITGLQLESTLMVVEHALDLNSPASVDEFLKQNPGTSDLVVIDTLARCMSGDENSTADMNMAIAECDRIRRRMGGDLILVHHQGWSKARPRGASALFGALDGLIRISRTPDHRTAVEVEALREGAVKENNAAIYSLVDGVMEPVAPRPKGIDKLREREAGMLGVLETLFNASQTAVPAKQWRSAVESHSPPLLDAKSKKLRDQQWRRAVDALTQVEAIKVHGTDFLPWFPADDFKEEDGGQ